MTEENVSSLIKAIKEFGFGALGLDKEDFLSPDNVIQLGYEPYRIDLLVDLKGIDFESCFERRSRIELDGVPINFLGLQDLIESKKNAGRLQDLADAEQLTKLQSKKSKKKDKGK